MNGHETTGRVHRVENDPLFEFLAETILAQHCGPIKRPVPHTSTSVEKAVLVFIFFVVEVVPVSRPTTANAKGVLESLIFRLVPLRVVNIGFGYGVQGRGPFVRSQDHLSTRRLRDNQNGA